MTPAERKAAQRRRDRLAGWSEVTVKVDADQVEAVRAYAASLPPPPPPTDPAQLSMLDQLDALLAGGDASRAATPEPAQGSLF
jgi:hypothetical protein